MGMFFSDDDKNELKGAVSALQACEYLGLPMKKYGSSLSIHCPSPEHTDRHLGTCMINPSKGGKCTCYACDRSFSSLYILQNVGGYSLHASLCILAELSGRTSLYEASKYGKNKNSIPKEKRLSQKEKELLGIELFGQVLWPVSFSFDLDNKSSYIKDGKGYVYTAPVVGDPLLELQKADKEAFSYLIQSKADEQISKRREFIINAGDREGNLYSVCNELTDVVSEQIGMFIYGTCSKMLEEIEQLTHIKERFKHP